MSDVGEGVKLSHGVLVLCIEMTGSMPRSCDSFETSSVTIMKYFSLYYLFHNS